MVVRIENDGLEILRTDFWQFEAADAGPYLSVVSGAFRLLLPRNSQHFLPTLKQANKVEVQPWTNGLRVDFLSHGLNVLSIPFELAFIDRLPEPGDGPTWICSVWTDRRGPRKVVERPAWYFGEAR